MLTIDSSVDVGQHLEKCSFRTVVSSVSELEPRHQVVGLQITDKSCSYDASANFDIKVKLEIGL